METDPPLKPPRVKKNFGRLIFIVAALTTLAALYVAEENWRGSRAWNAYKHALEAKGERFDIDSFNPPSVPDDQNLAAIPFFSKNEEIHLPEKKMVASHHAGWRFALASDLTNWAQAYGDETADPALAASFVLAAMDKQEPLIAELKSFGQRTRCRFNVDYDHWANNTNVQDKTLEHFVHIKWIFRVLSIRSEAELVSGQTDQALQDLQILFRVNAGVREEPLLISQLVGYATTEILLQPIAEGLAEHRWSDSQLKELHDRLRQTDLLESTKRAIRGERNICLDPYFDAGALKIFGWDKMEQVNCVRSLEDWILPCIDTTAHRVDPTLSLKCLLQLEKLTNNAPISQVVFHHTFFAARQAPIVRRIFALTAFAQTSVDEVRIACALERCRLAQGNYPASLEALSPQFATDIPNDVITGQPLKYRSLTDGRFILYSVGWNITDDRGKVALDKSGNQNRQEGDWVFEYPQ
jgi:hypothetical protein